MPIMAMCLNISTTGKAVCLDLSSTGEAVCLLWLCAQNGCVPKMAVCLDLSTTGNYLLAVCLNFLFIGEAVCLFKFNTDVVKLLHWVLNWFKNFCLVKLVFCSFVVWHTIKYSQ